MSKGGKASSKRQNAAKNAFKKKKLKSKANTDQLRDLLDQKSASIQEASLFLQKPAVVPDFSHLHKAQSQQNSMSDLESILRGL
ncbi:hypothetical protein CC1G_03294 [Coprinopsis cinerea okayama7|uniref:Uncharacterized protein n=1 Tax=Coprinopsis cinerea (strain Okayama-7 / 130 / ATCC MYA-4618 / FGSC 9003) TaxID=240176 RepID=A8N7F1_COPC7|nr:hypothetical protein CC1G_03294 [Coprinopsis cinerea okayama7\|eukprot:XP_001830757.1 hypothetical protein CC1G_03294 [Coprinopsis cinerea okayama7\